MRNLPVVCCYTGGGYFVCVTVSLPLLPFSMWSFDPLLWKTVYLVSKSFSKGNDPYGGVDLVCPWEEES